MDKTAILQHCVDLGDWFTAAQLCALDYRHVQVSVTLLSRAEGPGFESR